MSTTKDTDGIGDWNLCLTGSPVGPSLVSSRRPTTTKITSRPSSATGIRNHDKAADGAGGESSRSVYSVQSTDNNSGKRQTTRNGLKALSSSTSQLSSRSNSSCLPSSRKVSENAENRLKQHAQQSQAASHPLATKQLANHNSSCNMASMAHVTKSNQQTSAAAAIKQVSTPIPTNRRHDAALKIQRWYRRIKAVPRKSSVDEHSMKEILESKRQKLLQQWNDVAVKTPTDIDKSRQKEERARLARLEAIEELRKKREEKRNQSAAIANEEVSFLQASGKLSKRPSSKQLKANAKNSDTSNSSKQTREVLTNGAASVDKPASPSPTTGSSTIQTTTTFDELMSALKELEAEDQLPVELSRQQKSQHTLRWLDDIEKENNHHEVSSSYYNRTARTDVSGDSSGVGLTSTDTSSNVINYLDKVDVSDRLHHLDQDIERINAMLAKPALLVPSSDEMLEQASLAASEVTQQMLVQKMELEEKKRSVSMLQKALNQQRELTIRHAKETEKEMKKRLDVQKTEYEEAIKRHISFIDQLIDDKKSLGEKCEQLVKELKTIDKKYQDKIKSLEDNQKLELQKLHGLHEATEKVRREKWIEEKTKKIKEMTVKGLEPEIQRLIAQHKSELKKVKSIHEAELLASDERASQRYVKLIEELRDQLAAEKEAACARERQLARESYEEQLRQRELVYQQQQHRLYQEVKEEKERIADSARRQRAELDSLQRKLEETHSNMMASVRTEYDAAKLEQDRRHAAQIKQLQEQMAVEKEVWQENYRKKQDALLMQKERELQVYVKGERDKDIENVMQQLLKENQAALDECEREAEKRIRKIRDKLEKEKEDAEQSERQITEKYNQIKGRLAEVEGDYECSKVSLKQKEKDLQEYRNLLDKRNEERDHIADVIRQEFVDKIVSTEEENKRLKNEIAELKARHRVDLERAKVDAEIVLKAKAEEMEEVHKRVKQAITKKEETLSQIKEQYEKAVKRADHLEDLLEQQRKQLLGKK